MSKSNLLSGLSGFNSRKCMSNFESTDALSVASIFLQHTSQASLLRDMCTASLLGTMSDFFAQIIGLAENSHKRTIKINPNNTSSSNYAQQLLTALKEVKFHRDYNMKRTLRFLIFGFFDGAVGHTWFYSLDEWIKGHHWYEVLLRVVLDTTVSIRYFHVNLLIVCVLKMEFLQVYTPIWCVWFLAMMTLLERGSLSGLRGIIHKEWWSLCRLSTS
jgi:hypothetical protein